MKEKCQDPTDHVNSISYHRVLRGHSKGHHYLILKPFNQIKPEHLCSALDLLVLRYLQWPLTIRLKREYGSDRETFRDSSVQRGIKRRLKDSWTLLIVNWRHFMNKILQIHKVAVCRLTNKRGRRVASLKIKGLKQHRKVSTIQNTVFTIKGDQSPERDTQS